MTICNIQRAVRRRGAAMLFAAGLFLYGCIDCGYPYDPDLEITFDPCRNLQEFGVCVWDYPDGSFPSSGTLILNNDRVVRDGEIWAPVQPVLWPSKDRKICVIAYAPHGSAAAVTPESGVEFRGVDMEAFSGELLYSAPVLDISKAGGGIIPLTFSEALCRVTFRLRTDALPDDKVELKALRAKTLMTKGDFKSLPSPEWKPCGMPVSVTLAEGAFLLGGEPVAVSERYKMIPQRISTVFEADIEYTDANCLISHWNVATEPVELNFTPGRSYFVDLSFNVESCTLTAP